MKVFISGKITGEPVLDCLHKFGSVEVSHHFGGYNELLGLQELDEVTFVNPLLIEGIHFGISHQEAMDLCFKELDTCQAIFMLKDWKDSKGALMEHERAKRLKIKIFYEV